VKTVWQVRVLPLAISNDPAQVKDLQTKRAEAQKKLDALKAQGASPAEIAKLQAEIDAIDAKIASLSGAPACGSPFKEWDDLVADPDRRLNARTQPPAPASGPCVVPPTSGYRRLENQLYRVEVHTPGAPGTATFKWSRDNGSVVTAIEKMSGKEITVHDLGPDDVLGFASGQWVEISDDRLELNGQPGQLAQIDAVSSSLRRITLKVAPTPLSGGADGVDRALHPKLRRWDQSGNTATATGVGITGAWLPLEDGVEVQFGTGSFRTGDYWVIPARTATGEIEWPPFAIPNTAPAPQPPRGIAHHFCRLALLSFDAEKKVWTVSDDCRPLFPPLTEPCCTDDALHVVGTNWSNDDIISAATFLKDGLRIRLDAAPDPLSLTSDTMHVAIETPFPNSIGVARVYVDGTVTRDPSDDRVIIWMPPTENTGTVSTGTVSTGTVSTGTVSTAPATPAGTVTTPGTVTVNPALFGNLNLETISTGPRVTKRVRAKKGASATTSEFAVARESASARTAPDNTIRVRVTLKGHLVWSDRSASARSMFVDGQTFGQRGLRADGKSPRIALAFPSGAKTKASDFESWMFVGSGRTQPTTLQVTTVRFLNPNEANSSAGDVKPPVAAGQAITFKAGEQIRVVEVTFNRAVLPASVSANSPSIFITEDTGKPNPPRFVVDLQPSSNVVRVILRDPSTFKAGKYILTCLGTSAAGAVLPIVKAQDDSSALDGDYDNQAGGNLVLSFVAQ
jgi:hypothetical protein